MTRLRRCIALLASLTLAGAAAGCHDDGAVAEPAEGSGGAGAGAVVAEGGAGHGPITAGGGGAGAQSPVSSTPLPRVEAVQVPGGTGSFRLAVSHQPFVPRGSNYVRLAATVPNGKRHHSTFCPSLYDAQAAHAALAAMASYGYNLVRVFIDPGGWNRPTGINGAWDQDGLDPAYLDAVADFISAATASVIVTRWCRRAGHIQ